MFEQRVNSDVLTVSTVNSQAQVTQKPLRDSVKQALKNYFAQLNGQDVNDLYELVLAEVEQPLLDMVMQYTRGNQTRAALMMGINRGTLRKKLKKIRHELIRIRSSLKKGASLTVSAFFYWRGITR
ncbi:DNA-binding transcriptional regulator Fis [Dickeya oryzae]